MNSSGNTLFSSYTDAARKATEALVRNWVILPASLLAGGIFVFLLSLFGGRGFTGGLLLGMVQIVLISLYYCWLKSSIERERLKFKDLVALDGSVFSAVINTAFLLFVAKFFVSILIQGMGLDWVLIMIQFGIILFLNPLPEVVYYHRYDGLTAINEAYKFVKENWLEWFIPFVVLLVPWIFMSPAALLGLIAKMDEMLPATVLLVTFQSLMVYLPVDGVTRLIGGLIIGGIAMNWFMLFRGFLFQDMNSGSLRARAFRNKFR